jgi:alkylation response protein AidB-like acyl-CoA dehydrogenase
MELFGESIGRLAQTHVARVADAVDAPGGESPAKLRAQLDEQGLDRLAVPEKLGGAGAEPAACLVALELLAAASASVAMPYACAQAAAMGLLADADRGHAVLLDGTTHMLVEGGENVRAGRALDGAVEHAHGVQNARLAAVASHGDSPGLFGLVLDGAAVTRVPAHGRTGLRGAGACRMRFDAAPVAWTAGPPAAAAARRHLELACAAMALGTAGAALDAAKTYMGERRQFGRALNEFPALRGMVGAREADLDAAAADLAEVAGLPDPLGDAADARVAGATDGALRAATAAVDDAVQLHGGYGYVREYGIERRMRDVMSLRARAGASHGRRARVAAARLALAT